MMKRGTCFWQEEDGSLEPMCGCHIGKVIQEAIQIAEEDGHDIQFAFNDVKVIIAARSDPDLIFRDWDRAMNHYIKGPVGPYPAVELTKEEQASDARIETENEARRAAGRAYWQEKDRQKREAAESKLTGAPGIELADEPAWLQFKQVNADIGYGRAVVTYCERWARLMQIHLAAGDALEVVAKEASHEADLEGITGFQYSCAVGVLAQCWKHGEALRRWHNKDVQLGDEGEKANEAGTVLNPALLVLGGKKA